MSNIFNADFRDFVRALNNNNVEYILVGGYAVILHGYRRVTGDMDIWVNQTGQNYKKICLAFLEFRLPLFDMTEEKFLDSNSADVFSFGRSPVRIDIITKLKGVEFSDAYLKAGIFNEDELQIRFIHLNNLIDAKKGCRQI